MTGLNVAQKNELLFVRGVNFNDLPAWQKRGVGLYWELIEAQGINPVTGEHAPSTRRRIIRDFDLPVRADYDRFLATLLSPL